MIILFLIASLLLAAGVGLSSSRGRVQACAGLYYLLQAGFAVLIVLGHLNQVDSLFFVFDALGFGFFALMCVVSGVAFFQSVSYLDDENLRTYKIYHVSLMLLCASATAVYFANNLAVTWVFLEATTLCTAGLVYHRRNTRSLEATWKYIFVSSVGIAIAYLGILLLSTVATHGNLDYASLAQTVSAGNPLYLKIAFLFIFVGYSCKMEVFPLYTVGVDANFAASTPASAVISTVLVNAGFVAFFRVYRLIMLSSVYDWMAHVLLIAGVISVLIGAVYLRRTNNYKRFLAYSTVENMGIVLIGLGVGGIALFAVLFHVMAHTLIKSGMFFNIAQVGKIYGTYRINRIGNYVKYSPLGAISVLLGGVSLLAFPPSALFVSELLIFKQIILSGSWWLLVVLVLLFCFVIYSLCTRILQLCYKPTCVQPQVPARAYTWLTWSSFLLLLISAILGVLQPAWLIRFIDLMLL